MAKISVDLAHLCHLSSPFDIESSLFFIFVVELPIVTSMSELDIEWKRIVPRRVLSGRVRLMIFFEDERLDADDRERVQRGWSALRLWTESLDMRNQGRGAGGAALCDCIWE